MRIVFIVLDVLLNLFKKHKNVDDLQRFILLDSILYPGYVIADMINSEELYDTLC